MGSVYAVPADHVGAVEQRHLNDSGDDKLSALFAPFLSVTVEEKELKYAPEEHQECDREDKRNKRTVYDADEESDEADDLHS